ncbi:dolichyl pyrophosphate Man9GlcNAc2 alpha-1,3-glucosyltransferase [Orussus abietinus]|uniref:dolichyl pyrophosphate Man9GlcNAc2 alpha-1,3-glucosyltransferase n=1 Tax=Orussus abietinus TaxID=222816 RepID=UPI0006251031|nr:dolichyl pyrophosphate Man9GlcNAc2 alpha-1,3-glucosyltransferase [Orussus abietinus]
MSGHTIIVIAVAILLRWCITYHPYSGMDKPPMYGDYEAQRHWQEITLNLPVKQWYTNSTNNDLLYWGLDYPPLTAYHSLLLGMIANKTNYKYVSLHNSRGYESEGHKYFMRLSVLITDLMTYVPAALFYVMYTNIKKFKFLQINQQNIFGFDKCDLILVIILYFPGLILIDHGHFQYNCASLGFFIGAVTAILKDMPIVGSILFVLALNYKQMELYHALPFFFYILGCNTPGRKKSFKSCFYTLTCVSLAVIITFALIWVPFTYECTTFIDAISRLFPFSRGVFEDKVANIWCALNVIYKLQTGWANAQLAKICLALTAITIFPSCFNLYMEPCKEKFVVALINSALGFFLFSFQVHEKTILLVAIPVLLHFHNDPFPCFWFLMISSFSMLPLLIQDNLFLAFCATSLFYFISVTWMYPSILLFDMRKPGHDHSLQQKESNRKHKIAVKQKSFLERATLKLCDYFLLRRQLFYASMLGTLLLILCIRAVKPPERYPDLFPLLISIYSCCHFVLFFCYFNFYQFYKIGQLSIQKVKSS